MSNLMSTFPVGTKVMRDTFEGLQYGVVVAVGSQWVEVDTMDILSATEATMRLRVVA